MCQLKLFRRRTTSAGITPHHESSKEVSETDCDTHHVNNSACARGTLCIIEPSGAHDRDVVGHPSALCTQAACVLCPVANNAMTRFLGHFSVFAILIKFWIFFKVKEFIKTQIWIFHVKEKLEEVLNQVLNQVL